MVNTTENDMFLAAIRVRNGVSPEDDRLSTISPKLWQNRGQSINPFVSKKWALLLANFGYGLAKFGVKSGSWKET